MKLDPERIEQFYGTSYAEPARFSQDRAHTIEYNTSMHYLRKYLPIGCAILDCCAAAGAYAIPLARAGYRVTAGDLVKEHAGILNAANQDGLFEQVYQGNILNMPQFANETFDAVLCMGALYHLHEQAERVRCVAECLRVLKTGGIFVFAYINRNAVYINHFLNDITTVENRKHILETGTNDVFYTMDFEEPERLVSDFPLEKLADVGVDGLIYPLYDRLNDVSDAEFDSYMEYHYATCEQPSIIGHSMHGLWIGKKL